MDVRSTSSKGYWAIGVANLVVLVGSVAIAGFASHSIVRGEPDAYHNQHLRLLAMSVSLISLSASQLVFWKAKFSGFPKYALIFPAGGVAGLIWWVWLAR
jgi:hypothetical protein